ncbi:MAG: IS1 family transposase [Pyrinomonadaceae bacterium]
MANVLKIDKQIAVIAALAEGSSIRSIERITGINRNTIMNLGVRIGQGCARILDEKMRDLTCNHLQFDELWGFIGKKERHVNQFDDPSKGDVWTFCALDAETKLIPSYRVGKRTAANTQAFVADVASRIKNRPQISTDGFEKYIEGVELAFGSNVDYAQIIKRYHNDPSITPERRYSAEPIVSIRKSRVQGNPNPKLVSTSYVERANGTTRQHMKRLSRLTYAFSKKLENFEAAVALHFAYYNLVRTHGTLKMTPAMAAGVERSFWTVGDLVEAAQ